MTDTRYTPYIESLREKPVKKVLFVCLGNICRSPAAEGVMRDVVERHGGTLTDAIDNGAGSGWIVDSCGTGNYHIGDLPDRRMRIHARRRGYELTHICRQVRHSDFDNFDLIIPMDNSNERCLRMMAPTPESEQKIVPMAVFVDKAMRYDYIPDPYYEGAEGFELVLDLLENGCENIYRRLTTKG